MIRALTRDNIFLPEDYYETLLADYGGEKSLLARQELFGEFVNLMEGAIYWAFERSKHVGRVQFDHDHGTVYVGQDFNIDNMCNVYVQRVNGHYFVFEETKLTHRDANTDDASKKIVKDNKGRSFAVIPDSTAKARKTSGSKSSGSTQSDISIMESYDIEVYRTNNPLIRDRQNSLNMLFRKNKITIDSSCKHLIKELEMANSREEEGKNYHLTPALGYIVWYFDPLLREYGKSRSIAL